MEPARGALRASGGAEALLGELEVRVQDVVRVSSWWERHGVDCAILALNLLALPAGFLCLRSENLLVFALGIAILGVCHYTLTVKGSHLATHGALTESKRWSKIWVLFFVEVMGGQGPGKSQLLEGHSLEVAEPPHSGSTVSQLQTVLLKSALCYGGGVTDGPQRHRPALPRGSGVTQGNAVTFVPVPCGGGGNRAENPQPGHDARMLSCHEVTVAVILWAASDLLSVRPLPPPRGGNLSLHRCDF
ncbi:hypothetical protein J1605_023232 [Eschrichtius robustus]|uniref:Uncharacterized protein n=1 Tax=Eschrichtius robustus TaxID=9764 RepID=A0AB34H2H7_ESCRO|nr:hypothetical protein J1605_023232 [Eschrichtius robustus]